jgi:regulator of chromosome condensation
VGLPTTKRTRSGGLEPAQIPTKRQNTKTTIAINKVPSQRLDIYVFGSGESGELGLGHLTRNGKTPTNVKRPRLNDLLDVKTLGVV